MVLGKGLYEKRPLLRPFRLGRRLAFLRERKVQIADVEVVEQGPKVTRALQKVGADGRTHRL